MRKFREKASSESGFTLVELLVVMLILALLAAIAIPSFFNQRDKAKDSDAKAQARSAQTAMETYATDQNGTYVGATVADLVAIENTLSNADLAAPTDLGAKTYTVTTTSDTGNTFSIGRESTGAVTYTCVAASTSDRAGCPESGNWDGS